MFLNMLCWKKLMTWRNILPYLQGEIWQLEVLVVMPCYQRCLFTCCWWWVQSLNDYNCIAWLMMTLSCAGKQFKPCNIFLCKADTLTFLQQAYQCLTVIQIIVLGKSRACVLVLYGVFFKKLDTFTTLCFTGTGAPFAAGRMWILLMTQHADNI